MKVQIKLKDNERDKYVNVYEAIVTSTHIYGGRGERICSGAAIIPASFTREEVEEFWVLEDGSWPSLAGEMSR